jgi:SNF2-related domain/SNF2 Helicase protein/Helicase conserved C-terminal domain
MTEHTVSKLTTTQDFPALTLLTLMGQFYPAQSVAEESQVALWLVDKDGDVAASELNTLVHWLTQYNSANQTQKNLTPVAYHGVQGIVRVSLPQFLGFVRGDGVHRNPNWRSSNSLLMLIRLVHLAVNMVQAKDVMAFACPKDWTWEIAFGKLVSFSQIEDDSAISWSSGVCDYAARWIPSWRNEMIRAIRHQCLHTESLAVDIFLTECVDLLMREIVESVSLIGEDTSSGKQNYRVMYRGEEEVLGAWQMALSGATSAAIFVGDGWLVSRTLKQTLRTAGWQHDRLYQQSGREFYQLMFELIPPMTAAPSRAEEFLTSSGNQGSQSEIQASAPQLLPWKLVYKVVHRVFKNEALVREWWQQSDRTWQIGEDKLVHPDEWLLPMLQSAGEVFTPIAKSLSHPAPSECQLSSEEVMIFVTEAMPKLYQLGFSVVTPSFDNVQSGHVRIRVHVERSRNKANARQSTSAIPTERWFDGEKLVDFDWSVVIDDVEVSRLEFEQMVNAKTPFVELGGSWRLIPIEEIVRQIREFGVHHSSGQLGAMQFSRMLLMNPEEEAENPGITVDVDFEPQAMDVEKALHLFRTAHEPEILETPQLFQGILRHYQQLGFSWLVQLRQLGCGACLADDMGLGKTIQVLAYLLWVQSNDQKRGTHLLICPTSLLQNWRSEIRRFAPNLKLYVHHGTERHIPSEDEEGLFEDAVARADVVMTTYATVVRDTAAFSSIDWDAVIVDEAQNIKNAHTKQAGVVQKLSAFHRIALTGTPIENRLEELWSIFQFVSPGYFGNLAWFRHTFVDPLAENRESSAAKQLQWLLRPVLLRRRKTDPSIQLELPEKWENDEHALLTPEQAALYQSVVNRLFHGMEDKPGMSRRGQILAALVRLKQVCDHPSLLLGGEGTKDRSGKLKLLLELMAGVVEEDESALIFTQFRDMGEILCDALEERFGWRPQFLHGGLSATRRGEIVDTFQSGRDASKVLVLSLKAGGVGLNLTRANHVFHYDRWWNPAVEDQATDRVFRIGQTKEVQVHKMLCAGTLEERIAQLINSKRQLSQAIVGGNSEAWVTELDDTMLRELFHLDASALEEDD